MIPIELSLKLEDLRFPIDSQLKLFEDNQFENFGKQIREIFAPCREILRHQGLAAFPVEVREAFSALAKTQSEIIEKLRPTFSAFQALQDSLDLGLNQRMLPGLGADLAATLKQIRTMPSKFLLDTKPDGSAEELETPITNSFAPPRQLRRREARSSRPFLSADPQTSGYKSTDIGYLAILEYADEASNLVECDDTDL